MSLSLPPEADAEIEKLLTRYPHPQAVLLPVLHLAQAHFGHLSVEVQALVASRLGIPPVAVREVVTFYEMFHERPEGQYHLELCTNISCHLMGADRCMEHLKSKLGIEIGQHTEDGLFSLMEAECLASCGSGPTLKVGSDYYEYVTPQALDALLDRFRAGAETLGGRPYAGSKPEPHVGAVSGFEPEPPK